MITINNYNNIIELEHGGGGYKSWEIIKEIRRILTYTGKWKYSQDDGAVFPLNAKQNLVFTTDAFIVDPIFFPGGDIGKIAVSGTINDISVMGAKPLGIALSLVIEEGFLKKDLNRILKSIEEVARTAKVPIVTGDTKVTEKGKIDKIEITTAGIGLAKKVITNSGARPGDVIIASGNLGEHTIALLSRRFKYATKIKSDAKPLNLELGQVAPYLHACKDPTRGGLSANLVELALKSRVKVVLDEDKLPYKKATVAIAELLGLDIFSLASEGRFIAAVAARKADKVLAILKRYNRNAKVIGAVYRGRGVYLRTKLGNLRPIQMPQGKLIPRIC